MGSASKNLSLNIKKQVDSVNKSSDEDDDGLRTENQVDEQPQTATTTDKTNDLERTNSLSFIPGQVERRRRKLPEIPKNKKCK